MTKREKTPPPLTPAAESQPHIPTHHQMTTRRQFLRRASGLFVPMLLIPRWTKAQGFGSAGDLPFMQDDSAKTGNPTSNLGTTWAARVVVNGGAQPSNATIASLNTFGYSLTAYGITSKIIALNCLAPDSLVAMLTPQIVGSGSDPWTNHGFVLGDVTVNGVQGNGSNYIDTRVIAATVFSNNSSAGITVYNNTTSTTGAEMGVQVGGSPFIEFGMYNNISSQSIFVCWQEDSSGWCLTTGFPVGSPSWVGLGYLSGNRTADNAMSLYGANSGLPHRSLVSIANTAAGRSGMTQPMYMFAENSGGSAVNKTSKQLSFGAIHLGLTAAESANFYTAIQALRVSLGGGYI